MLPITRDKPINIKKIPPKKKKHQKQKISGTFFIKNIVTITKSSHLNEFIDKLVDSKGATLLLSARDYADYKDHILAYYYCLSLILKDFN